MRCCPICGGNEYVDSGASTPWGEWINLPCECMIAKQGKRGSCRGTTTIKGSDMCDLTTEVLVDDCVEYLFNNLEIKDGECHERSVDKEDYDRMFKQWLSETLCDLCGKCEDIGYYRGGGRKGLGEEESLFDEYWKKASLNIADTGLSVADVADAFKAGCAL